MFRNIIFFIAFSFSLFATAQLRSPEQFLGYKIGEKFTPHHLIIDYYKHVAANAPTVVKLQEYGRTNENRPLLVAYVSTAANLQNLENIRVNNLQLAQATNDRNAGSINNPAIVWLSYNVHGNEASSSEASMLTLYSLVDPNNTQTKQWLQNSLVIIDPCLNPDGRDRYVNWFNSVAGKKYDPVLAAREHNEPWPGGRVNHYYFDLNRDWAWQTQVETQQRLQLYHQWLPQIHVDFHEQGINQPYYFAPAAQPFHEVITPFQNSFQETIGRNHARYFDEKGWLYFTREIFDLFYPSYGDTYPIYNGAIGMTYEQAGGPAGGLGALTDEGDTLTLTDRALHHHTTGLSTIEVASKNAQKLLTEFQNYFKTAVNTDYGDYKSYVIKHTTGTAERINDLLKLLTKNKIQFGYGKAASFRGYNYDNGKDENFSVTNNDIIIPAAQPKGALVKVLFEPNPRLVDSATYDITAWAMPYAYGLKAYATKDKINITGFTAADSAIANPNATYGYVLRWTGKNAVKLAGQLLQKGIKLRYAEKPFEVAGEAFDRGSIIILKTGNQYNANLWNEVRNLANEYGVKLKPVSTGFVDKGFDFGSANVHPMNAPKIALFSGEGTNPNAVGEVWFYFDQEINYPVTLINNGEVFQNSWTNFDVLIMPQGNYRFLNNKVQADRLRDWVSKGGKLIALEAAVSQLAGLDWTIKVKKVDSNDLRETDITQRKYENRDREGISEFTPGSIFKVSLDNTHPLAFGYPDHYYTLKQDDKIYEHIKSNGWNVGILKNEKHLAGFVGLDLQKHLKDGMLFGTQNVGSGQIIYLADDVLFRNFWENGKMMFANAVFLVGQ